LQYGVAVFDYCHSGFHFVFNGVMV